jgi:hypothetical protein
MVDREEDVKHLNQRALSITSTAVLSPMALAIPFVVEDSLRKTDRSHSLGPCTKGSDVVVEYLGVTSFMHALEKFSDVSNPRRYGLELTQDSVKLLRGQGLIAAEHGWYQRRPLGLDSSGHHVEPLFIDGACEGRQ